MATITIPKKLIKEEKFVAIPQSEYKEFLRLRKFFPVAKLTPAQKRDLHQARQEYKRGEFITLNQLEYELGITRKKKS